MRSLDPQCQDTHPGMCALVEVKEGTPRTRLLRGNMELIWSARSLTLSVESAW